MTIFQLLIIALLLDAIFGEPDWLWSRLPHPVKLIGSAINRLDQKFNNNTKINGIAVIALLGIGSLAIGYLLKQIPDLGLIEAVIAAILIAQRSLANHVMIVADAMEENLDAGRKSVSLIVGRDTSQMDETAISRAAIESAAENFSDGVIAPAFWFLLLGLPGILFYKTINTADSMIAHKSDKYINFGWATAKLDDLLNLIPARLSALLICLASLSRKAFDVMRRDARQHRSPNAGWPESAMAGAMDIALSGPRSYGGKMGADPYVNAEGKHQLGSKDIRRAVLILWRAWAVFGLIILIMAVIF